MRPRRRAVRARRRQRHQRQLTNGATRNALARPGRIRRPGRNGSHARLLVVARQPARSSTRKPTPRDVESLYIADPAQPGQPAESLAIPTARQEQRPRAAGADARRGGRDHVGRMGSRQRIRIWRPSRGRKLAAHDPRAESRADRARLLLAVDPDKRHDNGVLHEQDDAWLNLEWTAPLARRSGKAFFWSSERNGGWQLELHAADGRLVGALTPRELGYRRAGWDSTRARARPHRGRRRTRRKATCIVSPLAIPREPGVRKPATGSGGEAGRRATHA